MIRYLLIIITAAALSACMPELKDNGTAEYMCEVESFTYECELHDTDLSCSFTIEDFDCEVD